MEEFEVEGTTFLNWKIRIPAHNEPDRACTLCGSVLRVTPQDALRCPRCGRVRGWTVTVDGQVVAAGRASALGGVAIWLAGKLEDLLPARPWEPAASRIARRLIQTATPDQPDRNWAARMGGK